jgi:hypothetical protein
MAINSSESTNIYGQKVVTYTENGKTVGKGTAKTAEAAREAAKVDAQIRNNKK